MRPRSLIATTVGILALLLLMYIFTHSRANGRKVSDWVSDLSSEETQRVLRAESEIHRVGTNAIPSLIRRVTYDRSTVIDRLETLLARQDLVHFRFPQESDAQFQAIRGFRAMGLQASNAVPVLVQLLDDPNHRRLAFRILSEMQLDFVVPAILCAATNADPLIRADALLDLGYRRSALPEVLSIILAGIKDADPSVRERAEWVLDRFPIDFTNGVPILKAARHDSDFRVRDYAARTLEMIDAREGGRTQAGLTAPVPFVRYSEPPSPFE